MSVTATTRWTSTDAEKLQIVIKEAWNTARIIQGSPTADIHRWSYPSENRAMMTKGTPTDGGASAQDCTVNDFSSEEVAQSGGKLITGDKQFVFYDYEIKMSDEIEWPASSDNIWSVIKVDYDSVSGRCEIGVRSKKITTQPHG